MASSIGVSPAAGVGTALPELVQPVPGGDQQPGEILGALGVAAEPEQVLQRPRRRHRAGPPAADGTPGDHGVDRPVAGQGRRPGPDPDVLGLGDRRGRGGSAGPAAAPGPDRRASPGSRSAGRPRTTACRPGRTPARRAGRPARPRTARTAARPSGSAAAPHPVAQLRGRGPVQPADDPGPRRRRRSGAAPCRRSAPARATARVGSPHQNVGADGSLSGSPSSVSVSAGRNGSSPGFSRMPLPRVLTTDTLPRRQACSRPTTPSRDSGRRSSGSA